MRRSFTLSQKIWFSLSILLIGYLFSMMQGFIFGQKAENRIDFVSNNLFPATQKCQSALNTYKEQVKLYEDAIRQKNDSILNIAKIKAGWCRHELESILDFKELEERNLNAVKEAIELLDDFTSSATFFYSQILSETSDKEKYSPFSEKSMELSRHSDNILHLLEALTNQFSDEHQKEMSAIKHVSLRQRYINLYSFIAIVIIALTLITLIMVRSVIRPLKKILMLERAVEQTMDGVAVRNLDNRNIFINEAWAKMHGYEIKEINELIGKKVEFFHTDEQYQNEVLPLRKIVADKGFYEGEVGHKRKDSSVFPTYMTARVLKNEKNRFVGNVVTARDISDQKHYEEQLKKANLSKSEFLADMSHEIRTPLNGVMGVLNLLLSTKLDGEQQDLVETGKRSSDSLLTIINDVLDFSKIEAGELDLETINFNLRNTIEAVVELPAMMAHDKGVEFIYDIHHDVPSLLMGDPGRLRQILINLSNNAIKFTHKGEIFIRVLLEEETDTYVKIRFEVRDTGVGIPEDKLDTVFESFKQTDSSITRQYGGTGLGLSISKKLTTLMKGEIGVNSIVGKGTTFWFTAHFEKQPNVEEDKLLPPPDIRGKRFILVDDNKTNLTILKGYLEAWGCSCELAESGEKALFLMSEDAKEDFFFDSAIIDFQMPEMNGAELGKLIKNDQLLNGISLIMLTSQGLRGEASRMKNIGFDAYLTKPIRRSQLYDCLITIFSIKTEKKGDKQTRIITKHSISDEKKSKVRILIVEDNIVNQKIALKMIEKFGFKADVAANGKEAIDILGKIKYDIVLMDIQMPVMDGFEASRKIRDSESNVIDHNIPIIAMTANAMKGDRERCVEAGMNDYTSKPIQPQELLKVIEKQIFKNS